MSKKKFAQVQFPFLDNLDLGLDAIDYVTQLLVKTIVGRDDVIIAPIGRNGNLESMLSDLDELFRSNKRKIHPDLIKLENEQRAKFSPRSIMKKWPDRVEDVRAYFKSTSFPVLMDKVQGAASIKFGTSGRLRPVDRKTAASQLKKTTNSGLPYCMDKGLVIERVLEDFEIQLSKKWPCLLFTRTQEANKTRTVWGYPIVDIIYEMLTYLPLYKIQKLLPYRAALRGPESVEDAITSLIDNAVQLGQSLVSIDFTSYDSSIRSYHRNLATIYYKSLFQQSYHKMLDYIAERQNTIGLITPDGTLTGSHGQPSGSLYTLETNSMIQYIIATISGLVKSENAQVQGDDGVYLTENSNTLLLKKYFKDCGLNVNEEKSLIANNKCIFLQMLFHDEIRKNGKCVGIYPLYRALNRIVYQERWAEFERFGIDGNDYYSLRTISILENCRNHVLFEDFVKLILKYDKYKLQYTDGGLKKYVEMLVEGKGSQGVVNNQYGDDLSGLSSFETVKLIKRL
jgi:hypothetical protein